MTHRDLWDEKAKECAETIEATSDPVARELLNHLKRLWMNLINQKRILTDADWTLRSP
jgi:hypothetical protein